MFIAPPGKQTDYFDRSDDRRQHWLYMYIISRRGANWQFNAQQKPRNILLFRDFCWHPRCSEFVAASQTVEKSSCEWKKTKYDCNVHRPVHVRFESHSLILWQFKPTISNQHTKITKLTVGRTTAAWEQHFVARITDIFFKRVHTECARNWRTGSG